MSLFKVTVYVDMEGREVKKLSPCLDDGSAKGDKPIYRGRTTLQAPGRPPLTVEFALPENISLKEAFEKFDGELNDLMAKEAAKQSKRLAVPTGPKLVGADGRPLISPKG